MTSIATRAEKWEETYEERSEGERKPRDNRHQTDVLTSQGLLFTQKAKRRAHPRAIKESGTLLTSQGLDSRTVRQSFSVILGHSVCSNLYGNPKKLIVLYPVYNTFLKTMINNNCFVFLISQFSG